MKHKCPCCGYYTLPVSHKDALAFICPVCFWEIDTFIQSDDEPSDSNHSMTLNQARLNFLRLGACEGSMLEHVRKPEEDEFKGLDD